MTVATPSRGTAPEVRVRIRAPRAWRSLPSKRGTEIHQGLVPHPPLPRRDRGVGQALDLAGGEAAPLHPGEDTGDVGVDHGDVGLVGEGEHGAGGVRADTREGEQAVEGVGERACLGDAGGGEVQVAGPPGIAEAVPETQDVTEGRGRAGGRVGEGVEEGVPLRDHPGHLGLLEHDLADEHGPRVAGASPGEVTEAGSAPLEDGVGQAGSAHTSTPSYGRWRVGAASRFHTITRRRK